MNTDTYEHPLTNRYGNPEMKKIFSLQRKCSTWRRLWLALAKAQQELGLQITNAQIIQMNNHLDDIDFDAAAEYEKEFHHDVVAHIHAFGDVAPVARPIIHLGATSQFVVDNADFLAFDDAMDIIIGKISNLLEIFRTSIDKYNGTPCLGYTHFQPAQPTSVSKRFAMWASDVLRDLQQLQFQQRQMEFRGVKGATGTQASFTALLGSHEKTTQLDIMVAAEMGCADRLANVCGQTYSRKIDANLSNALAGVAITAHKICNDVRLLSHTGEFAESFGEKQVGSSAMAYKRNPIKCEQTTSLARHVIALGSNQTQTASEQWLERSLDDSANRRISMPEIFLFIDAILDNLTHIIGNLSINLEVIDRNLNRELPFLATENILIEVVKYGADRQEAHEKIRQHSMAAKENLLKLQDNDLLERLKNDPFFDLADVDSLANISTLVGMADDQAALFALNMPISAAAHRAAHSISETAQASDNEE